MLQYNFWRIIPEKKIDVLRNVQIQKASLKSKIQKF